MYRHLPAPTGKKSAVAKNEPYAYPSFYGSHVSMMDKEETEKLHNPDLVVCKDERGLYVTRLKNLDTGLGDPFRCASEEWRYAHREETLGEVINIIMDGQTL